MSYTLIHSDKPKEWIKMTIRVYSGTRCFWVDAKLVQFRQKPQANVYFLNNKRNVVFRSFVISWNSACSKWTATIELIKIRNQHYSKIRFNGNQGHLSWRRFWHELHANTSLEMTVVTMYSIHLCCWKFTLSKYVLFLCIWCILREKYIGKITFWMPLPFFVNFFDTCWTLRKIYFSTKHRCLQCRVVLLLNCLPFQD